MRAWITLLLVGALAFPTTMTATAEQASENVPTEAELLAEMEALWAASSTLSFDEAAALLLDLVNEKELAGDELNELSRFLRDAEGTETYATLIETVVAMLPVSALDHSQDPVLGQTAPVLTQAKAAVCATPGAPGAPNPAREACLHAFAYRGGYYRGAHTYSYCTPTWMDSGTCGDGFAFDIMTITSFDNLDTRTFVMVQVPFSYEFHTHWYTIRWCFIWFCTSQRVYYWETHATDTIMGTNLKYEFAVPMAAGALATQGERDSLQAALEGAARIYYLKGREATSASALTGSPAQGAVDPALAGAGLGTSPGAGDLLLASPVVTAVGVQTATGVGVPPGTPLPPGAPSGVPIAKPGLPAELDALAATPLGPVYGTVKANYNDVSVRGRDFAVAPGASTGLTAIWKTSQLRSYHNNVAIFAADQGAAVPGVPAPPGGPGLPNANVPASFYYSAGSYFAGAGHLWTMDTPLGNSLV